jgi:hypothetical protein
VPVQQRSFPRGVRHVCNRTNYSIDRANTSELPARAATPVIDGYRPTSRCIRLTRTRDKFITINSSSCESTH